MQPPTSTLCVLCALAAVLDRAHVPGKMFFNRPLPNNLITVPSCADCNQGLQQHEEYLRAWVISLRGGTPSRAVDGVRARVMRQIDRDLSLSRGFREASELRLESSPDGPSWLGLYTRPDRARLWAVLTRYARGLHFWSTGKVLPANAPPSIERLFNRDTRPAAYWEPLLAGAEFARAGVVTTLGADAEFQLAFRAVENGDALSVMTLDFYQSFSYVAMMMKPGTDFTKPVKLPF